MKAFVIMPYGGNNQERVREFKRVFRYLIQDAVDNYDSKADIIRQDYSNEGGYIIRNVIDNLATADLVIADLSDNNWNVAYELGLRHVMSKYGTVLICNDRTELPYDIKQMNVILYPADDWIDSAEEISDQITKAIGTAMKQVRTDSPVFDVFPGLPDKLPLAQNDDGTARLMALNEELDKAKTEIRQLRARIEEAGLDSTEVKREKDLHEIMQKAVARRMYISDEAVSHLRELADEKKYNEFAEFLAIVLKDGYLDETDCIKVYNICRRLGIPDVTKTYLETVVEFYPDNEELRASLANAYSTDYHDRDKAISIVNEALGIRRKDGKYELVSKVRTRRSLATMFDVYLHLKKYSDIILIGNLLLERGHEKQRDLIYRNICYAAIYMEDFENARVASENAISTDPDSALNYYVRFKYFDSIGAHDHAIESLEQCIRLDSSDADYPFLIAGEICDELYARVPETMEIRRIDQSECEKLAVPYILRAFFNDPEALLSRTLNFFKNNKFNSTISLFSDCVSGKISMDDFTAEYDFTVVDYCLRKVQ